MQVATTINKPDGVIVKRVSVPAGLEEVMEGLTKEVLRKKPKDLYKFSYEYFSRLLTLRQEQEVKERVHTVQSAIRVEGLQPKPSERVAPRRQPRQFSRQMSIRSNNISPKTVKEDKTTELSKNRGTNTTTTNSLKNKDLPNIIKRQDRSKKSGSSSNQSSPRNKNDAEAFSVRKRSVSRESTKSKVSDKKNHVKNETGNKQIDTNTASNNCAVVEGVKIAATVEGLGFSKESSKEDLAKSLKYTDVKKEIEQNKKEDLNIENSKNIESDNVLSEDQDPIKTKLFYALKSVESAAHIEPVEKETNTNNDKEIESDSSNKPIEVKTNKSLESHGPVDSLQDYIGHSNVTRIQSLEGEILNIVKVENLNKNKDTTDQNVPKSDKNNSVDKLVDKIDPEIDSEILDSKNQLVKESFLKNDVGSVKRPPDKVAPHEEIKEDNTFNESDSLKDQEKPDESNLLSDPTKTPKQSLKSSNVVGSNFSNEGIENKLETLGNTLAVSGSVVPDSLEQNVNLNNDSQQEIEKMVTNDKDLKICVDQKSELGNKNAAHDEARKDVRVSKKVLETQSSEIKNTFSPMPLEAEEKPNKVTILSRIENPPEISLDKDKVIERVNLSNEILERQPEKNRNNNIFSGILKNNTLGSVVTGSNDLLTDSLEKTHKIGNEFETESEKINDTLINDESNLEDINSNSFLEEKIITNSKEGNEMGVGSNSSIKTENYENQIKSESNKINDSDEHIISKDNGILTSNFNVLNENQTVPISNSIIKSGITDFIRNEQLHVFDKNNLKNKKNLTISNENQTATSQNLLNTENQSSKTSIKNSSEEQLISAKEELFNCVQNVIPHMAKDAITKFINCEKSNIFCKIVGEESVNTKTSYLVGKTNQDNYETEIKINNIDEKLKLVKKIDELKIASDITNVELKGSNTVDILSNDQSRNIISEHEIKEPVTENQSSLSINAIRNVDSSEDSLLTGTQKELPVSIQSLIPHIAKDDNTRLISSEQSNVFRQSVEELIDTKTSNLDCEINQDHDKTILRLKDEHKKVKNDLSGNKTEVNHNLLISGSENVENAKAVLTEKDGLTNNISKGISILNTDNLSAGVNISCKPNENDSFKESIDLFILNEQQNAFPDYVKSVKEEEFKKDDVKGIYIPLKDYNDDKTYSKLIGSSNKNTMIAKTLMSSIDQLEDKVKVNKNKIVSAESVKVDNQTLEHREKAKINSNSDRQKVQTSENTKDENITTTKSCTNKEENVLHRDEIEESESHTKCSEEKKDGTAVTNNILATKTADNEPINEEKPTVNKELDTKVILEDANKENEESVTKIQALWRGYKIRKNFNNANAKISQEKTGRSVDVSDAVINGIIKIQAEVRGFIERKRFRRHKREIDTEKIHDIVRKENETSKNVAITTENYHRHTIQPDNKASLDQTFSTDVKQTVSPLNNDNIETMMSRFNPQTFGRSFSVADNTSYEDNTGKTVVVSEPAKDDNNNCEGESDIKNQIKSAIKDISSTLQNMEKIKNEIISSKEFLNLKNKSDSQGSKDTGIYQKEMEVTAKNNVVFEEVHKSHTIKPINIEAEKARLDALKGHVDLIDQVQNKILDQIAGKTSDTTNKFNIDQLRKELAEAATLYKDIEEFSEIPFPMDHNDELLQYLSAFDMEPTGKFDLMVKKPRPMGLPDIEEEDVESKSDVLHGLTNASGLIVSRETVTQKDENINESSTSTKSNKKVNEIFEKQITAVENGSGEIHSIQSPIHIQIKPKSSFPEKLKLEIQTQESSQNGDLNLDYKDSTSFTSSDFEIKDDTSFKEVSKANSNKQENLSGNFKVTPIDNKTKFENSEGLNKINKSRSEIFDHESINCSSTSRNLDQLNRDNEVDSSIDLNTDDKRVCDCTKEDNIKHKNADVDRGLLTQDRDRVTEKLRNLSISEEKCVMESSIERGHASPKTHTNQNSLFLSQDSEDPFLLEKQSTVVERKPDLTKISKVMTTTISDDPMGCETTPRNTKNISRSKRSFSSGSKIPKKENFTRKSSVGNLASSEKDKKITSKLLNKKSSSFDEEQSNTRLSRKGSAKNLAKIGKQKTIQETFKSREIYDKKLKDQKLNEQSNKEESFREKNNKKGPLIRSLSKEKQNDKIQKEKLAPGIINDIVNASQAGEVKDPEKSNVDIQKEDVMEEVNKNKDFKIVTESQSNSKQILENISQPLYTEDEETLLKTASEETNNKINSPGDKLTNDINEIRKQVEDEEKKSLAEEKPLSDLLASQKLNKELATDGKEHDFLEKRSLDKKSPTSDSLHDSIERNIDKTSQPINTKDETLLKDASAEDNDKKIPPDGNLINDNNTDSKEVKAEEKNSLAQEELLRDLLTSQKFKKELAATDKTSPTSHSLHDSLEGINNSIGQPLDTEDKTLLKAASEKNDDKKIPPDENLTNEKNAEKNQVKDEEKKSLTKEETQKLNKELAATDGIDLHDSLEKKIDDKTSPATSFLHDSLKENIDNEIIQKVVDTSNKLDQTLHKELLADENNKQTLEDSKLQKELEHLKGEKELTERDNLVNSADMCKEKTFLDKKEENQTAFDVKQTKEKYIHHSSQLEEESKDKHHASEEKNNIMEKNCELEAPLEHSYRSKEDNTAALNQEDTPADSTRSVEFTVMQKLIKTPEHSSVLQAGENSLNDVKENIDLKCQLESDSKNHLNEHDSSETSMHITEANLAKANANGIFENQPHPGETSLVAQSPHMHLNRSKLTRGSKSLDSALTGNETGSSREAPAGDASMTSSSIEEKQRDADACVTTSTTRALLKPDLNAAERASHEILCAPENSENSNDSVVSRQRPKNMASGENTNTERKNNNVLDRPVGNEPPKMETQAATKIQAGFRGYQVRRQLKVKHESDQKYPKKNSPKGKPEELEEKSAVKIQAGVRGFLVRRRQKKQDNSASA